MASAAAPLRRKVVAADPAMRDTARNDPKPATNFSPRANESGRQRKGNQANKLVNDWFNDRRGLFSRPAVFAKVQRSCSARRSASLLAWRCARPPTRATLMLHRCGRFANMCKPQSLAQPSPAKRSKAGTAKPQARRIALAGFLFPPSAKSTEPEAGKSRTWRRRPIVHREKSETL
jgi:hypothetical protein